MIDYKRIRYRMSIVSSTIRVHSYQLLLPEPLRNVQKMTESFVELINARTMLKKRSLV